jgi:hypothetical protein
MAELSATPKETVVGSFRTHSEYDPLPALRRYGGPTLAVVTSVNDAKFDVHNFGVDLPHNAFGTIGHWLRTDKTEEFTCILDEFIARVRTTRALRTREPRK